MRALRRAGELATIDAPVDPRLEIAEISDRVVKAGGPALLFRNVRGSAFPVLTNQFGTERRTALALGAKSLRDVEERLRSTIDLGLPALARGQAGPARFAGERRRFGDPAAHQGRRAVAAGRHGPARPRETAGADDVAARRRAVHHAAARVHARSADAPVQRRHVPRASVRRHDGRHALAAPQARPRARREMGPQDSRRGGGRRRSRADVCGDGAAAARRRRARVRRVSCAASRSASPKR